MDESFKFAMDWDLILRFRDAGATFMRLPRFLGAFRVTDEQKTVVEDGPIIKAYKEKEKVYLDAVTEYNTKRLSVAFYRYHVREPVWFHRKLSFNVSEQKFKVSPGDSDWSSTAFFYFDRPDNDLSEIQGIDVRTAE